MQREHIKYDIPEEWLENRKKGLCPVCAKTKDEFDKFMKVYCSVKCQKEYGSHIYTWNELRDKILNEKGVVCEVCGVTEVGYKEKNQLAYQKALLEFRNNKDEMELLRKKVMDEIESLMRLVNDDELLLKDRGHYSRNFPREYDFGEHISFEVDHKVAIVNGGDMWDKNNLRVLCSKCHREKTNSDLFVKKNKKNKKLGDNYVV